MATKSISQLDSAVSLALGDLFEIAEPDAQSQTGYASKKISLSQEAAFIQENVESQNLNTTSKTLVGAINEVDSEGVKWSENNVIGGKNLLIFPYTETYDTELTVVYLPNGGVKVSCSNISAIRLIRLQTRGQNTDLWIDPSKRYKLSLVSDKKSSDASGCAISLIYYNGSTNLQNATAYANGEESIVNVPSTNPNLIECYLLIPKSTTLDNETFYPMIRNEEVLDGTWMPYADTNHGLSINKADLTQIATVEMGKTASKAYAIGDYMIWQNEFYKVTAAISQGGAITRNTNVSQTTIGAELTALFAALA